MSDNINNWVNLTLESIHGITKATPKPFLLTRIKASLNKEQVQSGWSNIAFYLKKPAVAAVAILLVILVNVLVISNRNNLVERENITKSITPQKYDFAINVSVMYDSENQEP